MAKNRLLFLKQFFKLQREIGSLLPSTEALGNAMASRIPLKHPPIQVLEVGPGTGPITERLIERLGPDDQVTLIELNPEFCAHLQLRIEEWSASPRCPKITLHKADVLDYRSEQRFDFILCSLPFNNHSRTFLEQLFTNFQNSLVKGGTLSYFEYVLLRGTVSRLGPASYRDRLRTLNEFYRERILPHVVARETVVWNFPPAMVFHLCFK